MKRNKKTFETGEKTRSRVDGEYNVLRGTKPPEREKGCCVTVTEMVLRSKRNVQNGPRLIR
jgi:hypothetical protein